MNAVELYYATNRAHQGDDRSKPDGYGTKPSGDGNENLRFGCVTLEGLDKKKVKKHLDDDKEGYGKGNGVALSKYYSSQMSNAKIAAIEDDLDENLPAVAQNEAKMGSVKTFEALREKMQNSCDVVIFIHGYSVSWNDAVASAMALQTTLNVSAKGKEVAVVLFSWPSDGQKIPIYSYKSDRGDAEFSGKAFGRSLLKFRDFLLKQRTRIDGVMQCEQEVHLLCHSMGNYMLEQTLGRLIEFNHGLRLPRLFDHIFMCSPDVDDDVLEKGKSLERLPELARSISIYYNRGDVAMYISDYTKQNPDRLGLNGVVRPSPLGQKVHQIDCSDIVTGAVEHSYYLNGNVNEDIRFSLDSKKQDYDKRKRYISKSAWPSMWVMEKGK